MATDNETTGELIKDDQMASMPMGLAMIKMQNDQIASMAVAHPRNYEVIKADLQSQINAFPELAYQAIYSKPVGREPDICAKCKKECFRQKGTGLRAESCYSCHSKEIIEGKQKFARNLSVRAAETLAESCGYNWVRSDVTILDDTHARVEATFSDLQKGRIWQDGRIVSKLSKRRNGSVEVIAEDRFYNVVVQAEKSKTVREVINRSMPAGLKAWFFDACEKVQKAYLATENVQKIIDKFAEKEFTKEDLEYIVGRTVVVGWREKERLELLGIWTSLEDGEVTKEDLLRQAGPVVEPDQPGGAPVEGGIAGALAGGGTPPTVPPGDQADKAPEKKRGGRPAGSKNKEKPTDAPAGPATSAGTNTSTPEPQKPVESPVATGATSAGPVEGQKPMFPPEELAAAAPVRSEAYKAGLKELAEANQMPTLFALYDKYVGPESPLTNQAEIKDFNAECHNAMAALQKVQAAR